MKAPADGIDRLWAERAHRSAEPTAPLSIQRRLFGPSRLLRGDSQPIQRGSNLHDENFTALGGGILEASAEKREKFVPAAELLEERGQFVRNRVIAGVALQPSRELVDSGRALTICGLIGCLQVEPIDGTNRRARPVR